MCSAHAHDMLRPSSHAVVSSLNGWRPFELHFSLYCTSCGEYGGYNPQWGSSTFSPKSCVTCQDVTSTYFTVLFQCQQPCRKFSGFSPVQCPVLCLIHSWKYWAMELARSTLWEGFHSRLSSSRCLLKCIKVSDENITLLYVSFPSMRSVCTWIIQKLSISYPSSRCISYRSLHLFWPKATLSVEINLQATIKTMLNNALVSAEGPAIRTDAKPLAAFRRTTVAVFERFIHVTQPALFFRWPKAGKRLKENCFKNWQHVYLFYIKLQSSKGLLERGFWCTKGLNQTFHPANLILEFFTL